MDIFSEFYGDLYGAQDHTAMGEAWSHVATGDCLLFSIKEARSQLHIMAKNKAADSGGLVIEMLQEGSDNLLQAVVDAFNDILKPVPQTPAAWAESRARVLYKKGDALQAENYRPITLSSIMYKLFSRPLNARMESILDQAQSVDQAGYRSGFGVDDHLFTAGMLIEGCAEFNVPLWACTVDF